MEVLESGNSVYACIHLQVAKRENIMISYHEPESPLDPGEEIEDDKAHKQRDKDEDAQSRIAVIDADGLTISEEIEAEKEVLNAGIANAMKTIRRHLERANENEFPQKVAGYQLLLIELLNICREPSLPVIQAIEELEASLKQLRLSRSMDEETYLRFSAIDRMLECYRSEDASKRKHAVHRLAQGKTRRETLTELPTRSANAATKIVESSVDDRTEERSVEKTTVLGDGAGSIIAKKYNELRRDPKEDLGYFNNRVTAFQLSLCVYPMESITENANMIIDACMRLAEYTQNDLIKSDQKRSWVQRVLKDWKKFVSLKDEKGTPLLKTMEEMQVRAILKLLGVIAEYLK